MKGRESGMPEKDRWNSFFDAGCVIDKLFGEAGCCGNVVEFGCGYGTFSFPATRHATGIVCVLDIEPGLIAELQVRAKREGIANIVAETRDFLANGTGLGPGSQSRESASRGEAAEGAAAGAVPRTCVLDPDGDIVRWLVRARCPASRNRECHCALPRFGHNGRRDGSRRSLRVRAGKARIRYLPCACHQPDGPLGRRFREGR